MINPGNEVLEKQYTYLALGDSYTVGESVELNGNFPYQLVSRLSNAGLNTGKPVIMAETGWTTDELQAAISSADLKQKFDFVTLLIGVNNQFRGYSEEIYRKEFSELLQTAIDFSKGDQTKVFVISIPNWGVTPYGQLGGRGRQVIAAEIDVFNAVNKEESLKAGVSYTDITPASRKAAEDLSLVASDGLHPSSRMYADWAVMVAPSILKSFNIQVN